MKLLNNTHQIMHKQTLDTLEEWTIKRLKYLAKINPSKEEIKEFKDTNTLVTFLPMEKVSENGEVDGSILKPIHEVWNGFTYFRINDVIIAKITPCFENGKGALLTNLENGIGFGSTEFHVLRPKLDEILPKYLYYLTESYTFMKMGESEMIGAAGQKRVPQSFLENFHFLIPSINVQKIIVNYLDYKLANIFSLISKKQKLIDLLKEERSTLINQAVIKGVDRNVETKDSDIEWLGKIPVHWKIDKIRHLFNHIKQPAPVGNNEKLISLYAETGVDLRENLEQRGNKSTTTDNYWLVKKEDIIVNKLLAWMGAVGISGYEGVTSPAYDVIRAIDRNKVNPYYYNYLFRLKNMNIEFKRFSKGILEMRLRLYFNQLGQIKVPIPPIEEQTEIISYIGSENVRIDKAITKIQKEVVLLQEYRTALISEVVTGKIDVREEVVSWT